MQSMASLSLSGCLAYLNHRNAHNNNKKKKLMEHMPDVTSAPISTRIKPRLAAVSAKKGQTSATDRRVVVDRSRMPAFSTENSHRR